MKLKKLSIEDLDLAGKKVFIRVDYNVPLGGDRRVEDDTRIVATLPTLNHALDKKASLVLASHLGRPKGKVDEKYSLEPVAGRLSEILDRKVLIAPDCVGDRVFSMKSALEEGEVLLLENLRFHKGETEGDGEFSKDLARGIDHYVNDAFGTAHRAHASVSVLPGLFEQPAAGFLMNRELESLSKVTENPETPYAALLGGAKISDKIAIITNLIPRVDSILIGGAMSYTILKAQGHPVGQSLVEEDQLETAVAILDEAEKRGVKILLPTDHVVSAAPDGSGPTRIVGLKDVAPGEKCFDIGPDTVSRFSAELKKSKTILWNGPLGLFEKEDFQSGTRAVARAVADSPAFSVVGGGDTISAVKSLASDKTFGHLSTAGGALLELLSGKELPGITSLRDK